jgi:hypothetical protein
MAAATVSAAEYVLDLQRLADYLGSLRSSHDQSLDGLFVPFKMQFALATTNIDDADDIVRLVTFPAGFYLADFSAVLSDMDTHATPALVGRFVMLNSADAEQFDVTGTTTAGQGGGGVDRAAGVAGRYVGGLTLAWKTNTAAATAAAGTLTCYFPCTRGVVNEVNEVPMLLAYP